MNAITSSNDAPRSLHHGINNQLAVLLGYLQLISQSPHNAAQVGQWSEKALAAYRKLESMIQQLEEK